jgi:hypothetical protein
MPSTQAIKIIVSIQLQHAKKYRIVMINITYQKKIITRIYTFGHINLILKINTMF